VASLSGRQTVLWEAIVMLTMLVTQIPRRSTTGFVFILNGGAISWNS